MSMQQYQLEMSMQNTAPQSSAYSNPWLKAKEVHTHNQTLQQQQYVASCNVLTNKIQQQQQQGGAYGMNNINMQPTITAVSGTASGLNGQMWYNQSASRAVNQVTLLIYYCYLNFDLVYLLVVFGESNSS